MDEVDRLDFRATWARELVEAVADVAPEAHPDEAYDVYLMAFGGDLDIDFMRAMTDEHFVQLRDAARTFLESPGIETAHVKAAIEATVWHWSD